MTKSRILLHATVQHKTVLYGSTKKKKNRTAAAHHHPTSTVARQRTLPHVIAHHRTSSHHHPSPITHHPSPINILHCTVDGMQITAHRALYSQRVFSNGSSMCTQKPTATTTYPLNRAAPMIHVACDDANRNRRNRLSAGEGWQTETVRGYQQAKGGKQKQSGVISRRRVANRNSQGLSASEGWQTETVRGYQQAKGGKQKQSGVISKRRVTSSLVSDREVTQSQQSMGGKALENLPFRG
jgi:hypothetical protein